MNMKRNLLLAALAIAGLSTSAQTYTVTANGQPVQNGSTIDCYDYEFDEYNIDGVSGTDVQINPRLFLSTEKEYALNMTVTNNSNVTIPDALFCWPTTCVNVKAGQSQTQTGTSSTSPQPMQIDSDFFDINDPAFTLPLKVEISRVDNAGEKFSFTVNLIWDPSKVAAVDLVEVDDVAPVYYDLAGRRVLNPEKGALVIERRGAKAVKKVF